MTQDGSDNVDWKWNLMVLWVGTFIAGIGFSEIMPFLSLYVGEMGSFTKHQVTFYSSLAYAATFLVVAIVSPIWGKLADRHGRKIMLLRASFGMALIIGGMGFVHNVYALIALRFLQGLCAGYISNASALIATETPKIRSGTAIGTLATGPVTGNLIGPLLGGVLAHVFSIRLTFIITGVLLFIVFMLTLLFVHETFVPPEPSKSDNGKHQERLLSRVKDPRGVIVLLAATAVIQMCNNSITPILSLFVKELMHGSGPVTIVAGLIAALPGIATLVAAPRLGSIGDRIGTGKILTFGFLFAVLMYIPQGFVTSVWILGIFRLLIGISDGALFPTVQTMLSKKTPPEVTGSIFSWNQSAQALGSMAGSLAGGVVSNAFGYNGVFLFTASALFVMFVIAWRLLPDMRVRPHVMPTNRPSTDL